MVLDHALLLLQFVDALQQVVALLDLAHAKCAEQQSDNHPEDKEANKITIKHGPMPSLDMPAMTMVFQVKDPALLEKVKAGDKVQFEAQKLGGAFTVIRIEPAK